MSRIHASALIERMKADEEFSRSILTITDPQQRVVEWQRAGFDCTIQDVEDLHVICANSDAQLGSLPLTWQCKGPCHTKCTDIRR